MALRTQAAALSLAAVVGCALLYACGTGDDTIRLGAIYPQTGSQALGAEELHGVQLAVDMANASGGVAGKQVRLTAVDAPTPAAAVAGVDELVRAGIRLIFGTYSTSQALPATLEAAHRGAVYVETGSLSDTLTGRGLPGVYRTSVSGGMLGRQAVQFTRDVVLPQAHVAAGSARLVVVYENDSYGASVGDGAVREAAADGLNVAAVISYNLAAPDLARVARRIVDAKPTVIITGQYQADAIGLRKELGALHVPAKAIIGASSAYSSGSTGAALGGAAGGLFAADRGGPAISAAGLMPAARSQLVQVQRAYRARFGRPLSAEATAGFVGAWVILHEVLVEVGNISQSEVADSVSDLDLPPGSEIDGSGVHFAPPSAADAGQNELAAGVVFEWLGGAAPSAVYPPKLAVASPRLLALS